MFHPLYFRYQYQTGGSAAFLQLVIQRLKAKLGGNFVESCCCRFQGAITGGDLREGKDNLALIPSKVQGSENLYAAVPFSFSPRDGTWILLIFDVSWLRLVVMQSR